MKKLLTALLLVALNGIAQEVEKDSIKNISLHPVTIIGDKGKMITGSGQYLSTAKIEQLNQPNINSVLRVIPGINIRDEEGFGLRPNIGLRGTAVNRSAKITLMEDGILIAPAPYADPSAYYFPTFARMQGVEVLKGSSQIKYGPYTIGGAINLLSTAIPDSFKAYAQLSYGSFATNQQRFWIGDVKNNFDYVFEVNRLASNGFKELPTNANTGFDRQDFMGKLRWHTSENAKTPQAITLKFVNTTEDSNETYLGLTYQDYKNNPYRRYAATEKDRLDLKHQHLSINHTILPFKGLNINTTVYYTTVYRDWARANTIGGQSINNILSNPTTYQTAYQIMTGAANGTIDYQSAARTYQAKGAQTNAIYRFKTNEISHKINIGLRYHTDEADRFATRSVYTMTNRTMILTSVGVKGNQENQIRKAEALAGFISYDFQYKKLKISSGIRYEKINLDFENFGTNDTERLGTALKTATNDIAIILPGIGFNYEINSKMTIFGGIHKGFSPPGMPSTNAVTTQAKPEKSINYEIAYRYQNSKVNAQIVGFFNDYTNILGSDNVSGGGAGTGDMFNAGNAIIKGVELNITYDFLYNNEKESSVKLPISLIYTYNDAKFKDTFINGGGDWGTGLINSNDRIPFVTPHLLTTIMAYETKKFNMSIIGKFTGQTRTKPAQDDVVVPTETVDYNQVNGIDKFLIFDFSANYKINQSVTLFSTVNNLFNNKAIVANLPQGYRPNIPQSVNFGIKLTF